MFSRINSRAALWLLVLSVSCSTQKKSPAVISEHLITAPVFENTGAYLIKRGDKLLITNLNWSSGLFPEPGKVSDNQTKDQPGYAVPVNADGTIMMPEVGRIMVTGLSGAQLADSLAFRYRNIVREPIFEVEITNLRVKVLGACNIQGLVALDKETLSLGEVLARAGGIKYTEAGDKIQVIRGDGKAQKVIEYDFQQLGDPKIMNLPIYPDDIIYIPPSKEGVRSVKLSRKLIILQPVLIALNLALLVINIIK
jgi:polysaccharide export outer membrane protein